MTIRKWARLFWTTLLWGIAAGIGAGLILQVSDQQFTFAGLPSVGFNLTTMLLGGAMISVLCHMGFFSYLIMRQIIFAMIRNKTVWDLLQLFIVLVTLYELASLRYLNITDGTPFIRYFVLPFIILVLSLAVAYWKMKLTNGNAFIPTLFFMTVATILEAVPALKLNNAASTFFMLAPLFCCNAWQILTLHKVLADKKP